jgi:hypothetical protein
LNRQLSPEFCINGFDAAPQPRFGACLDATIASAFVTSESLLTLCMGGESLLGKPED